MPSKSSGKTDLYPVHRVAGSNNVITTSLPVSKSPSDVPHMSADPEHSDPSSYSSSFDAASPLHFHGLAVTQTQTQVASSAEASCTGGAGSESRAAKRKKVFHDPNVHSPLNGVSKTSNEPSKGRPASRAASKLKGRRSSSLTSIDSFAEAEEWEDPTKAFLASNPRFEVPFSELGRGATRKEFHEAHHSTAKIPPSPTSHEPTQVDPHASSSTKDFLPSGSGAFEVQRSGVQNDDAPSQVSDVPTDAPGRNHSPISDIPDDASTPPVLSNPGLMDHLDAPADDHQATQPLASEDLYMNTTQVSDAIDLYPRPTSPQAWSPMASRPSTNARNILSMVNPEKKWRLRRGEQLLKAALQSNSDGQTQPSTNFSRSSHVPSTGRLLFDQLAAQRRDEEQSATRRNLEGQNDAYLLPLDEDSRETVLVPDSEPPVVANMSSTPTRPHSSTPPNNSQSGGMVDSRRSRPVPAPMDVEDRVSQHNNDQDGHTDDDNEEDIPLLLTVRRPDAGAAPLSTRVSEPPKSKVRRSRLPDRTGHVEGTKVSTTRRIDPRDKEIPSSVPEQDHRTSAVPPTPPRSGPRRRGKERDDAGDVSILSARFDQVTPAPDEDSTEPADDLPTDDEDDAPTLQDSVSLKRKRLPPVPPRRAAYRSAPRATSNTPSMVSDTRAIKRIKHHHPTATRVFALWRQDAAYFSGIVCEQVGQSDRFKIHFDDGDEDIVDVRNLRRLELRAGDRVSIIQSQEKATIANVNGPHQAAVIVRLIDDPSTELEVDVMGIKIQSRAIKSQWGNRMIDTDEIVTWVPRAKSETPSSFRNSSTSLNKKKVLTKVGIVVTLSVGRDREKEKEIIMRTIRTNGGTVLDDWSDIFSLAGEYSANKKRWVIASDNNIGTEMKHDIQQVFLVSDAANTKPRFLTALALGIPCLSVEWLRGLSYGQCIVSDWPNYLLPAGYSDSLGARVTQIVDLDWGTTLDHLTGIMSNNVAMKLFSNKSVLVLGPEYFPPPAKGKKGTSGVGDEKSNDGGRFIPRIIVSMGAARVEAVPELKYSSNPDLKDFHYVVVKDLQERPSVGGEKYVSMEWVKDCLIAGRMFPPRV